MDQFKMFVTETDLKTIKEICADHSLQKSLKFEIISETHIDKEFWQIEVIAEELFAVYHIGRLAGYNEGKEFMRGLVEDYEKMCTNMIQAGKGMLKLNEFLQSKIK